MLIQSTKNGLKLTNKIVSAQIIERNELKSIIKTCEVLICKGDILYSEVEHIIRELDMIYNLRRPKNCESGS